MKINDHDVPAFRPLIITIESQQELVTIWSALNMSTIYGCKKAVVENGISEDLYRTTHIDVLWKALRDRILCTVPNCLPVLFASEPEAAKQEQEKRMPPRAGVLAPQREPLSATNPLGYKR